MNESLANCYTTLEVMPTSSAAEVKQAYLDLVKVWHPDRFPNEPARFRNKVEEKLKAINLAYEQIRCGAAFPAGAEKPVSRQDLENSRHWRPTDFGAAWGYVDAETGEVVIAPRFQSAAVFSEGLALVRESHRFGYIGPDGEYSIYPEFLNARSFSEGLAAVVLSSLWGYIDRGNRLFINPLYESSEDFSAGLAAVCWRGRWGYIDNGGSFVIRPRFDGARAFSGDWGQVKIGEKWAKINRRGDVFLDGRPVLLA